MAKKILFLILSICLAINFVLSIDINNISLKKVSIKKISPHHKCRKNLQYVFKCNVCWCFQDRKTRYFCTNLKCKAKNSKNIITPHNQLTTNSLTLL